MISPSAHELDIVRSAHVEADSFSYSPVFSWCADSYAGRVAELIFRPPDDDSTTDIAVGWCESGHEYYRLGETRRFQRFVSLFCKGILHTSDVLAVFPDPEHGILSKNSFRHEQWNVDKLITISRDTAMLLTGELAALALLLGVNDHLFDIKESASWAWQVSAHEQNIAFSSDGRFAIYDFALPHASLGTIFAPLPESLGAYLGDSCHDRIEHSLRVENAALRDIFMRFQAQYAGEEGYRLFRAIVRHSRLMPDYLPDSKLREHYDRMILCLRGYIASIDSGEFHTTLRDSLTDPALLDVLAETPEALDFPVQNSRI